MDRGLSPTNLSESGRCRTDTLSRASGGYSKLPSFPHKSTHLEMISGWVSANVEIFNQDRIVQSSGATALRSGSGLVSIDLT